MRPLGFFAIEWGITQNEVIAAEHPAALKRNATLLIYRDKDQANGAGLFLKLRTANWIRLCEALVKTLIGNGLARNASVAAQLYKL